MGDTRRHPSGAFRNGRSASRTVRKRTARVGQDRTPHRDLPDLAAINAVTPACLPELVARWLPDGRWLGREWMALNRRREDRHLGSFKVNLQTGQWADFTLADARGGDPISLAAYLSGKSEAEAAWALAAMLGYWHDAR